MAANYLHKGSKILVEGRLQSRSYDAQDGTKRYVTEVIVSNLEFCESRRQESAGQAATMGATGQFGNPVSDRDIPF
ncbi:MAG: single-stranded DNA-binding protein [Schwartzia sp. (in: firmicutes)]